MQSRSWYWGSAILVSRVGHEQHMGYSILNANHMANGAITNIGFLASQLMTVHVYAHT